MIYFVMLEVGIFFNLVIYNIIIRGFFDVGLIKEVEKWLSEMKSRGMCFDEFIYNVLIFG